MKNSERLKIKQRIENDTGIQISQMLSSMIENPEKIQTLNAAALKTIVIEYAPIYRHYRNVLDGDFEMQKIGLFSFLLCGRLTNKPELEEILSKSL